MILDSFLEGISNLKGNEFRGTLANLDKTMKYFESRPNKKYLQIYSLCLALLIINWIQVWPDDRLKLKEMTIKVNVADPTMCHLNNALFT